MADLELREKVAYIDRKLMENVHARSRTPLAERIPPWALLMCSMLAGAALLAAGVAAGVGLARIFMGR